MLGRITSYNVCYTKLLRVVTHILDVDFQKIREFTGTYDDWYIAANVIAKQQEMENAKKVKEKAGRAMPSTSSPAWRGRATNGRFACPCSYNFV